MSLVRARALRGLQSNFARASLRVATPRAGLVARRYASSEHGHGQPSSDLPWLISALAVTPVACWYLWPDSTHADAGHHGEHGSHAEHEESHEEGKSEDKEGEVQAEEPKKDDDAASEEKSEDKSEDNSEDKSEDKPEGKSEEKSEEGSGEDDQPSEDKESKDTSSGDSSGQEKSKSSGVNFKGKMNADSAGHNHTKKIEPGNKGGNRIRLDSGLGKNLGEGHSSDTPYNDSEGAPRTSASAISDKQKGLSNTDTRHSTRPDEEGSGFSTKGGGGPETAKSKNTIDHKAPVK